MADGKPGRGSDQFPLRFPDGMREELKALADRNGRSMNSEIIARLQETISTDHADKAQFERIASNYDWATVLMAGMRQEIENIYGSLLDQRIDPIWREVHKDWKRDDEILLALNQYWLEKHGEPNKNRLTTDTTAYKIRETLGELLLEGGYVLDYSEGDNASELSDEE